MSGGLRTWCWGRVGLKEAGEGGWRVGGFWSSRVFGMLGGRVREGEREGERLRLQLRLSVVGAGLGQIWGEDWKVKWWWW